MNYVTIKFVDGFSIFIRCNGKGNAKTYSIPLSSETIKFIKEMINSDKNMNTSITLISKCKTICLDAKENPILFQEIYYKLTAVSRNYIACSDVLFYVLFMISSRWLSFTKSSSFTDKTLATLAVYLKIANCNK